MGTAQGELLLFAARLDATEREVHGAAQVVDACQACGAPAAQLLGISFRSFRYRYEKLGLDETDPEDG